MGTHQLQPIFGLSFQIEMTDECPGEKTDFTKQISVVRKNYNKK